MKRIPQTLMFLASVHRLPGSIGCDGGVVEQRTETVAQWKM